MGAEGGLGRRKGWLGCETLASAKVWASVTGGMGWDGDLGDSWKVHVTYANLSTTSVALQCFYLS